MRAESGTNSWQSRLCTFVPLARITHGGTNVDGDTHITGQDADVISLSHILDQSVLQLRKEVPLELVVSMFQKMVRPPFTSPE